MYAAARVEVEADRKKEKVDETERMAREKKNTHEKEEIRKVVMGKRKRNEDELGMEEKQMIAEKEKEEKVKKGNGGGILTNKLFSELYISELTAKAIREMNYSHLTEVRHSRLRLYICNCIVFSGTCTSVLGAIT